MNIPYDLFRSRLHKDIRRGYAVPPSTDVAHYLADRGQTLISGFGTIVLEDIGIGDRDAVLSALTLSSRLAWKPMAVKVALVRAEANQLAASVKSRDACDLTNAFVQARGAEAAQIRSLAMSPPLELIGIAADGSQPISRRVAAVAYLGGTDFWRQTRLPRINQNESALIEALIELNLDDHDRQIVLKGAKLGNLLFAGYALAAHVRNQSGPVYQESDSIPPVTMLGDMPSYALDQYTELGRQAVARWCATDTKLHKAAPFLTPRRLTSAVNLQIFVVESGCLVNRAIYDQTRQIEANAFEVESAKRGLALPDAIRLRDTVLDRLDRLNAIRAELYQAKICGV